MNGEIRNDQAEALHLEIHHAVQLLKLAALASKMRRALRDIDAALEWRPDLRQALQSSVPGLHEWKDLEDPTAECLGYLGQLIEEASDGLVDLAFDRDAKGGTQ